MINRKIFKPHGSWRTNMRLQLNSFQKLITKCPSDTSKLLHNIQQHYVSHFTELAEWRVNVLYLCAHYVQDNSHDFPQTGGTFVVDSRCATYASRKLAGNLYLHTMAHLLKTTKELLTLFNFDNNITVGFFIVQ